MRGVEGGEGLLAGAPVGFAADHVERGAAGGGVEPADERGVIDEGGGFAGEEREDFLRDVFGEVAVGRVAARGVVDERKMTLHQLREGGARSGAGVGLEELGVIRSHRGHRVMALRRETEQRKMPPRIGLRLRGGF